MGFFSLHYGAGGVRPEGAAAAERGGSRSSEEQTGATGKGAKVNSRLCLGVFHVPDFFCGINGAVIA